LDRGPTEFEFKLYCDFALGTKDLQTTYYNVAIRAFPSFFGAKAQMDPFSVRDCVDFFVTGQRRKKLHFDAMQLLVSRSSVPVSRHIATF
jgi:hypothetical protein